MTVLSPQVEDQYRGMAALYDAWVQAPGYRRWVVGLVELARERGLAGSRALDVGCGTGLSTAPMADVGLEVTACDPSSEMLAHAARRLEGRATLVAAGLPELPRLGAFDLVTALNDVINHLPDRRALEAGIAALAANLAPGGLLVLDATTLGGYRRLFATTHCRERDGAVFVWRGSASGQLAAGATAGGVLDAFTESGDGCWRRVTARFVQRHHPHSELGEALRRAGLETLAVLGQHDDGRRDQHAREHEHIKRVYLARKP